MAEETLSTTDADHPYAELISRVSAPISEDEPAGADVKYDPEFEKLKSQINRLGSAAGDVDFDFIVEGGFQILEEKSKDLMTAGYLGLGLARTKGADGIAEALVIVQALIDHFWEELHPQKEIRRRNSLQFIADRFKQTIQLWDHSPKEAEREPLEIAQQALSAIQSFTMEEMEENAPALSGLVSALRDRARRLPNLNEEEEGQEQQEEGADEATPEAGKSVPAAAPTEVSSQNDARSAVNSAATFLRAEDPTSPAPYQLMRSLRWGVFVGSPPHEDRITRIDPPLKQRRNYLSGLLEEKEFETLLMEAEKSFQSGPFHVWLDLQRLQITATSALGEPYQPLTIALKGALAELLQRVPELPSLRFSDETPFASGLTKEWIDAEILTMAAAGGGRATSRGNGSGGADEVDALYEEAREKLGAGDLSGALAHMKNSVKDGSQRARFRRRLYEAQLCVRAEQHSIARAILEGLDHEVEAHGLDLWYPPLALQVWGHLHDCYKNLARAAPNAEKASLSEQATQTLHKIARLDADRALQLK